MINAYAQTLFYRLERIFLHLTSRIVITIEEFFINIFSPRKEYWKLECFIFVLLYRNAKKNSIETRQKQANLF